MAMPRGAFLLIAFAVAGSWYVFDRSAPHIDSQQRSDQTQARNAAAATDAPLWFREDDGGCLLPRQITRGSQELERPRLDSWRTGGSGDVLREDPCGNVWALWFNSWVVHVGGAPDQRGSVALPQGLSRIAHSGITDFLPRRGELWLLGRHGQLIRYRQGLWQDIALPEPCLRGQLLEHDGDVVLACHATASTTLRVWDERDGREQWRSLMGNLAGFGRLAQSSDGRLIATGSTEWHVLHDVDPPRWMARARSGGPVVAMAADSTRLALADASGLEVVDDSGRLVLPRQEISGIRGVALSEKGIWLAVQGEGLRYFDGENWHDWRYATGLADDAARDLLISRDEVLWLAGTPSAAIEMTFAARAIAALTPPSLIDHRVYPDACVAADAELTRGSSSGQISRESGVERKLVFFRTLQVCPNPYQSEVDTPVFTRRVSDGALLRMQHNPHRGTRSCTEDCEGAARDAMSAHWRFSFFVPKTSGVHAGFNRINIPAPDPLPRESPMGRVLLPDDGSIWFATRSQGLFRFVGKRWNRFGDNEGFSGANPVIDLASDHLGRVLVLSQPSSQPAESTGEVPLHWWQAGTWSHASLGRQDTNVQARRLVVAPNTMLVLTNGPLLRVEGPEAVIEDTSSRLWDISDAVVDDAQLRWVTYRSWGSRRGLGIHEAARVGSLDTRGGLFADRISHIALDAKGDVWMLAEDGKVAVYARQTLFKHARWSDDFAVEASSTQPIER